jgi:hypothetical protein
MHKYRRADAELDSDRCAVGMRSRVKRKERKKEGIKGCRTPFSRGVSTAHAEYCTSEARVSATTLRGTDQYWRITCFAFVVAGREQPFASSQRPAAQELVWLHIHGAGRHQR